MTVVVDPRHTRMFRFRPVNGCGLYRISGLPGRDYRVEF